MKRPDSFDNWLEKIAELLGGSPGEPAPPLDHKAMFERARVSVEQARREWQSRLEVANPAYWQARPLRSRETLSVLEVAQGNVVAQKLRAEQKAVAKRRLQSARFGLNAPSPRVFCSDDAGLWAAREVLTPNDNTFLLRFDDQRDFFAQWPDVEPLGCSRKHHTFQSWAEHRAWLSRWEHTHTDIALIEKLMREHGGSGKFCIESHGSYTGPLASDSTESLWHWDGARLEFVEAYMFSVS